MEKDPKGGFYTFDKGVEKTGGGEGFAIEYRVKRKDLTAAYSWPADIYDEDTLENPLALNLERSDSSPSA